MLILALLFLLLNTTPAFAVKAFPSAEGYGADDTVGGRGGTVMYITNRNDSGAGSFRACAEGTGARTCIFKVGGMIELNSRVTIGAANSFVTIAGQTAPGEGVTIGPWPIYIQDAHDVIIRHLRHRQAYEDWGQPGPPPNENNDCGAFVIYGPSGSHTHHVIIDHASAGYECDDGSQMSGYVTDSTVQWYLGADAYECKSDGTNCQIDPYGSSKGFIFGGNDPSTAPLTTGTVHHSAFLQSNTRNPGGGPQHVLDWRYNLVYHWTACTGGLRLGGTDENVPGSLLSNHNFVGNRYIPGPDTNYSPGGCWLGELRTEGNAKVYVQDNVTPYCNMDSCDPNTFDIGWGNGTTGIFPASEPQFRVGTPFAAPAITATLQSAMENTLSAKAGATVPKRDALDARVISEMQQRTGDIGRRGQPFPTIANCDGTSTTPAGCTVSPTDSDGDGMPDSWESANGTNPSVADNNVVASNGYTNLENYLNQLAGDEITTGGTTPPANGNTIYLSAGGHGDTPTDAGDCTVAETITTPRATLTEALACMKFPGKTLLIRGGTYPGIIDTTGGAVLGGADAAHPTTIAGYQAEVVTIQMPIGGVNAVDFNGMSNFTIDKITVDAMARTESNAFTCQNSNNITISNSHFRNSFYEVAYINGCSTLTISKSIFHDANSAAAITLAGSNTTIKLEELDIYNASLQGIDAPSSSGTNNDSLTISKTQIHNTGLGGSYPAINLGTGNGALLVNNIIDHNNAGILIRSTASGAKILHNAIASNTNVGLQCDSSGGSRNIVFQNNLIYGNGTDTIVNNCLATLAGINMTTNPLWVDSTTPTRDFHLQPTSTAIDAVPAPPPIEATTAIDGTIRPVGSLVDLGPYEQTVEVPPIEQFTIRPLVNTYLGMFY